MPQRNDIFAAVNTQRPVCAEHGEFFSAVSFRAALVQPQHPLIQPQHPLFEPQRQPGTALGIAAVQLTALPGAVRQPG